MPDRQIRDEAVTLFLAGHETTANALAWSFYLLGAPPRRLPRASPPNRAPCSAAARRRWTICRACRRRSGAQGGDAPLPAGVHGRPPGRARRARSARSTLRRGDTVFVNIYAMHRRADYLRRARTSSAPSASPPSARSSCRRGAYLPFGAGPRICIGNHFALMEGQLILAALAQRVRFVRRSTRARSRPSRWSRCAPRRTAHARRANLTLVSLSELTPVSDRRIDLTTMSVRRRSYLPADARRAQLLDAAKRVFARARLPRRQHRRHLRRGGRRARHDLPVLPQQARRAHRAARRRRRRASSACCAERPSVKVPRGDHSCRSTLIVQFCRARLREMLDRRLRRRGDPAPALARRARPRRRRRRAPSPRSTT